MSVSGVPCRDSGSGDTDGCGVGSVRDRSGASAAIEIRDDLLFRAVLAAAALLRLGGDLFVGDIGSSTTLSGGLKICEGSTDSLACVCLRVAVRRFGVVAGSAVRRRGDRIDFAGAGVKSSSSSPSCCRVAMLFSMSELPSSSATTFRRVAARREGRSGDAADMATVILAQTRPPQTLWDAGIMGVEVWMSLVLSLAVYGSLPNLERRVRKNLGKAR